MTVPQGTPDAIRRFLNEEQDPVVVQKIYDRVVTLCTAGEEIQYIAVQKKPVVTLMPDAIVLTTRRALVYTQKLLGMEFKDFLWLDVQNVHMKESLLGAVFSITSVQGDTVSVEYVPKTQARRLYQFAQQMEEQMKERRRQRFLEEKRAAAGGVIVQSPVAAQAAPAAEDPIERLKKLKGMLELGLISQQDFDVKKEELLARL